MRTPEELAGYFRPAACSAEHAERLRGWAASLMVQLDAATVADLVVGVNGRVVFPEAS